jgi:dephospho-CoA kinase
MGSGKGEVVKILERIGFWHITLSQMVREEAQKHEVPEERERLMEVGNEMRRTEGADVLGKRALTKIQASNHNKWVVDGIRNPTEIDALRKGDDVHIVGLHAAKTILIERILKRKRDSDPNTSEAILHRIEREWGKGEGLDGQRMEDCMAKADLVINNEGTLEELDNQFFEYYNTIR